MDSGNVPKTQIRGGERFESHIFWKVSQKKLFRNPFEKMSFLLSDQILKQGNIVSSFNSANAISLTMTLTILIKWWRIDILSWSTYSD